MVVMDNESVVGIIMALLCNGIGSDYVMISSLCYDVSNDIQNKII